MTHPDRDDTDAGLRTVRAILAVRRGPRGAQSSAPVACPHCGAPRFEPCLQIATQRPLAAMHPSRAAAADRRDEGGAS